MRSNNMFKMILTAICLALIAVLAMAPAAFAKAEYIMKYGHIGPETPGTKHAEHAKVLKGEIETWSNGRIEVQVYPASQLGGFREMLEQVQMGTLEMTSTTCGGMSSFFPEIQVTDLPYMFKNEQVVGKFGQSPFWIELGKAILKKTGNIRLAAIGCGGFRHFCTTKPVKKVADMKGMKIRTINSPLQQELVRALGASPTPMAWGDLYTSLQTGVVEGTKNNAEDMTANKMVPPVKHIITDGHAAIYDMEWVSNKWLKSLPEDLQIAVIMAVRSAGEFMSNHWKMNIGNSQARFKKAGGTLVIPSPEVKAEFLKAKPVVEKWFVTTYPDGAMWLDKMKKAIADTEKGIEADALDYIKY